MKNHASSSPSLFSPRLYVQVHCRGKEALRRTLTEATRIARRSSVCIVPLFAFLTMGMEPKAMEDLEFLAAQQQEYARLYDKLSYKAFVTSRVDDPFYKMVVDHKYISTISRRGNSLLLTREADSTLRRVQQRNQGKAIGVIFDKEDEPNVQRLLVTETFTVFWPDLKTPMARIHLAQDWQEDPKGHRQNYLALVRSVDIARRSFGPLTPFHETYRAAPKRSVWSTRMDGDKHVIIRTLLGDSEPDLILTVNPRHGAVIPHGRFAPKDAEVTADVTFTPFDVNGHTIHVPETCRSLERGKEGSFVESLEIHFSEFKDESDLPPYTLNDLGLPDGALVQRVHSEGRVQPMVIKGDELKEAS